MIGRVLARYRVVAQLGAGGMGVVYRARDESLERDVALKVLPAGALSDEAARARFRKEALALSQLNHPHICTIHEVGEAEGVSFIAMELVEGRPLGVAIGADGLPAETVARYGAQIADALAHAHSRGIGHRDLKGSNVMLTPEGRIKVLDFGLAKRLQNAGVDAETRSEGSLTQAGAVVGSLHYMAPETLRGDAADARTDLWALGVLLYEMAAARRPFTGRTGFEVSAAILQGTPAPFPNHVPASLKGIIQRCLAKEPGERYQRAEEVRAALEAIQSERAVTSPSAPRPWWRLAALILVLVAVAVAAWRMVGRGPGRIESLAVLPLENLSGDAAQDYFSDGITETLIADLAKLADLRVLSRSAVMQYKGVRRPGNLIARELGVDAVVEGSVARAGERVRITAQLLETRTDRRLWSEKYERDLRDILSLQAEVAGAIAGEVRGKVRAQPAAAKAVQPEAYDLYLRARFHSNREGAAEHNQTAITLLEKAVQLDPTFAAAFLELGRAYGIKAFYFSKDKEWEEKAYVAMEKATTLGQDSGEAHYVRGSLLWRPSNRFPHREAIQEYRRALALNPALDDAHHQIGLIALHIGLLDLGFEELRKAVALNPSNTLARFRFGAAYAYQGKFDQAVTAFDAVPRDFHPLLWGGQMAWALFELGRRQEAVALLEETLQAHPADDGGFVTGMKALLAAAAGQTRQAEQAIQAAERQKGFGHFHHTAYTIASAYAQMNRPQQAVEWLRQAAADGFPCYPLFDRDHSLDPVRKDPQFQELLARLKQQWESYKASL